MLGLPLDLDPEVILTDVQKHIKGSGVIQMTRKGENGEKPKLHIFLLVTPAEVTFRQLQGIDIYYHKVDIRK